MQSNATKGAKAKSDGAEDLKLLYIISYLIPLITGILVYLIYGTKSKRLRFHAVQAVLYSIALIIIDIVLGIVSIVLPIGLLVGLLMLVLWLYGLYVGYRAMEGEDIKITTVGELAEKYS